MILTFCFYNLNDEQTRVSYPVERHLANYTFGVMSLFGLALADFFKQDYTPFFEAIGLTLIAIIFIWCLIDVIFGLALKYHTRAKRIERT